MTPTPYLDATPEAGKAFYHRGSTGPIFMLNLLKFNEVADYTAFPELAPDSEISGQEAYRLYMKHTLPYLEEAGAEVLFSGKAGSFLIGPESESWDMVILVKHASIQQFLAFARNPGYLQGAGHRTAALLDSRLLPMDEI